MSEFIRLQANGVDAYPDASTENTYRSNGTSVESALLALESNVNTLGGVAGEAKTLAEQNSVKIATAEQEISDINSSLEWKFHEEKPADTYVLLPSNFNELYVVGRIASWNFDFIFPYIALTDELKHYFNGFYLAESANCMCQVSISKNKVKLEYEGDGSIKVFYR